MITNVLIIPWKTIEAEIKARNLNQKEVARRLWTSEKNLIDLIKWEITISPEMALKLEYVFWISAQFWLNFDKMYQEQKVRIEDEKQLKNEELLAQNYLSFKNKKALIKLWHIRNTKDKLDLIKQIKQFFSVSKLETVWNIYKDFIPESSNFSYYRKNDKFTINYESLYTFFRIWEIEASKQTVWEFDLSNRKDLLNDLHQYLKDWTPNIEKIKETLNKYWIYFSFLSEDIDQLPIKWFVKYYWDHPLLQLTSKWKYTDIFWFNLYHELWHIYKHLKKKNTFIDSENWTEWEVEKDADSFANKNLIDENSYKDLVKNYSLEYLEKVSKNTWIHKWIFVWRLAFDKKISWNKASKMRGKIC